MMLLTQGASKHEISLLIHWMEVQQGLSNSKRQNLICFKICSYKSETYQLELSINKQFYMVQAAACTGGVHYNTSIPVTI